MWRGRLSAQLQTLARSRSAANLTRLVTGDINRSFISPSPAPFRRTASLFSRQFSAESGNFSSQIPNWSGRLPRNRRKTSGKENFKSENDFLAAELSVNFSQMFGLSCDLFFIMICSWQCCFQGKEESWRCNAYCDRAWAWRTWSCAWCDFIFFVIAFSWSWIFFLFVWLWWRDDYGFDWLVSFREGTFWMQTILLVRLVQRLVLFAFFRIQPIALTDSRSKSNPLLLILNVWLHIWFLEYYLDGK